LRAVAKLAIKDQERVILRGISRLECLVCVEESDLKIEVELYKVWAQTLSELAKDQVSMQYQSRATR